MKKEKVNLFDVIPFISEHITTEKEDDFSVITFPRFRNTFMQKYLVPNGKSAYIHIKLDEHGTKVWDLLDGNRNVREIADELAGYFNGEENYELRVTTFISQLQGHGFIKYKMSV